jgi:hypothetical protein
MKYFVQDGESEYSVVLSQNPTEAEAFAAEELVSFVKQVTGAKLPIKSDSEVTYGADMKVVSVGANKLSKRAEMTVTAKEVNTDGFLIKNVGEMIFINGYYDRGTLYGVYEFIEKYLGVKFLTADTTYVPTAKDVMVEKTLDILEKPAFEVRHYYANTLSDFLFAARKRMTVGGDEAKYGGGFMTNWYDWSFHNTMPIVKTSPVFEEHKKDWLNQAQTTICYTNGLTDDGEVDADMEVSVVKTVIEEMKRRILDSKPTQKFFMIGQEDNASPCKCERCQDSVELNGSRTGMMIVWMNAIVKEIEAWAKDTIPNKEWYISCFAYQWSSSAPVSRNPVTGNYEPANQNVVPHKNLYVMYAPIEACFSHTLTDSSCSKNKPVLGQLEGWAAITDRLLIWEYGINYRHYPWWFPNLSVMKDNLRTYYESGAAMIRNQGGVFDDSDYQMQLKTYVLSELMWNFEQDVYDIIHEFNQYYYEEAAESINAFVDLFESHFAMLNIHTEIFENTQEFLSAQTYPLEFLQKAIAYIEEGKAIIEASNRSDEEKRVFKSRLERASLHPYYMIAKNIKDYGLGEEEKENYLTTLFRMFNDFEITNLGEGRTAIAFKEQYGY